jgi:hypothetical protein
MFHWFKNKKNKKNNIILKGINSSVGGSFEATLEKANGDKQHICRQHNMLTNTGYGLLTNTLDLSKECLEYMDYPNHGEYDLQTDRRNYEYAIEDNNNTFLYLGDGTGEISEDDKVLFHTCASVWYDSVSSRFILDKKDVEYPNEQHPNHIKMSAKRICTYICSKYAYNLTELGLGIPYPYNSYKDNSLEDWLHNNKKPDYYEQHFYCLLTHALFKDEEGNPLTISVAPGDKLTITYYLDYYIDVRTQKGEITIQRIGRDKQPYTEEFEYTLTLMDDLIMRCFGHYDGFNRMTCYPKVLGFSNGLYYGYKYDPDCNTYKASGSSFTITHSITEECLDNSNLSQFNIDDYTNAILDFRNKALTHNIDDSFYSNGSDSYWLDCGKTPPSWWYSFPEDFNENILGVRSALNKYALGILNNLTYVDRELFLPGEYSHEINGTTYTIKGYKVFSKGYGDHTLQTFNKNSLYAFVSSPTGAQYGNFNKTDNPEEYSYYTTFTNPIKRAVVRYSLGTLSDPDYNYTITYDPENLEYSTYTRAMFIRIGNQDIVPYEASGKGSVNSSIYTSNISARFLLVLNNKATNRGLKKTSNEYLQMVLESTVSKWDPSNDRA